MIKYIFFIEQLKYFFIELLKNFIERLKIFFIE